MSNALQAEVARLAIQVRQADERGDDAMRRAHAAEALLREARHQLIAWSSGNPPVIARIDDFLSTSPTPATPQRGAEEALENVRLFAARHRKEQWAKTVLCFCADGGAKGSPLRYTSPTPAPAKAGEQDALDAARYRWLREHHCGHISEVVVGEFWSSDARLDAAIDAFLSTPTGKEQP